MRKRRGCGALCVSHAYCTLGRDGGEPGAPGEPGSLADTEGQQSSETNTDDVTDCKDPIDVVSGMMFLPQTDLRLPGLLPLVLTRTFRSNYRQGHWFGRRWASFLDQRVEVSADGVHFADQDGVILHYPPPEPGRAVLPVSGSRWPLAWDRARDEITVTDPRAGHTLHFPASGGRTRPLRSVTDRNGHRVMVLTDEFGVPSVIAHTGGYRVAIDVADTRSGLRISGLRLLDGTNNLRGTSIVAFGYDPFGNLVETVDSSGLPLVFEYDDEGRITKWIDRNGTEYEYEYDEAGRVVRTSGTDGMLAGTMSYDAERRITYSTDSFGAVTEYHWDGNDRVVKGDRSARAHDTEHLGRVRRTGRAGGRARRGHGGAVRHAGQSDRGDSSGRAGRPDDLQRALSSGEFTGCRRLCMAVHVRCCRQSVNQY